MAAVAARSILRSTASCSRGSVARVTSASKPKTTGSPFRFATQKPLSARIFRSPVEISSVQSMLPYHSVTASVLLTSMLSVNPRTYGWTLEVIWAWKDDANYSVHSDCKDDVWRSLVLRRKSLPCSVGEYVITIRLTSSYDQCCFRFCCFSSGFLSCVIAICVGWFTFPYFYCYREKVVKLDGLGTFGAGCLNKLWRGNGFLICGLVNFITSSQMRLLKFMSKLWEFGISYLD